MNRRRSVMLGALGSVLLSVSARAVEQPPSAGTITLVVPFAPGGSTDLLGRALAERLSKRLQQPVIVENRPGAGTAVAAERVARAKPDGATLLLASSSTMVFNPLMGGASRYDPVRDFAGISLLAMAPMLMVVPESLGVSTVEEFVGLARRSGDRMAFGSAGQGSALHLAAELFMSMSGLRLTHVPFRGSAQALSALAAGEIQLYFDLIPSSRPLVRSGRLKAIAVTGQQRSSALPTVPTLTECGYAGYEATTSFALVVPRLTGTSVVRHLHTAVTAVLADNQLQQQFAESGLNIATSEPDAVSLHFAKERSHWQPLIEARGIRLDN